LLWKGFKYQISAAVRAPYTVHEMAADALGVLDALAVASAHIVAVSMGAMIAQRVERLLEPLMPT
jgi:pimeloyl-ACP methyl ester carboxylesterase